MMTHVLIDRSYVRQVGCNGPVRAVIALFYPDGEVGIAHFCKVLGDDRILCAPKLRLGAGHSIASINPLTVTPSILCRDCGMHGYITAGSWADC